MIRRPPDSTLFPSPPLFRSVLTAAAQVHFPIREPHHPPVGCHIVAASYCDAESYATGISSTSKVTDRKSTRLNSSHANISYAVFCLKKKKNTSRITSNDIHT